MCDVIDPKIYRATSCLFPDFFFLPYSLDLSFHTYFNLTTTNSNRIEIYRYNLYLHLSPLEILTSGSTFCTEIVSDIVFRVVMWIDFRMLRHSFAVPEYISTIKYNLNRISDKRDHFSKEISVLLYQGYRKSRIIIDIAQHSTIIKNSKYRIKIMLQESD